MTIFGRTVQIDVFQVAIIVFAALSLGCSPTSTPTPETTKGSTKDEVLASLGEPDRTQVFVIPDQPFFGPQEGLIDLVPAGTEVEEWAYDINDQVLYVWFAGDDDALPEDWRVIETASYPHDAVF